MYLSESLHKRYIHAQNHYVKHLATLLFSYFEPEIAHDESAEHVRKRHQTHPYLLCSMYEALQLINRYDCATLTTQAILVGKTLGRYCK